MQIITVKDNQIILRRADAIALGFKFDLDGDISATINGNGSKDIQDADKIATIINCFIGFIKERKEKK